MRLVGGDRCSCGSVWAPWAVGHAFWGGGWLPGEPPCGRVAGSPGRMLDLSGCRSAIFSWNVMGLFSRSHLSHPMFLHLCFCCTTE